jgi:histidinol-phosphate/aromatic aminotransferase/cobyric acid decarboxylase-like protein
VGVRVAGTLVGLGCTVLPWVANLFWFGPPDAAALADALQRQGLVVRRYGSGPMDGWLRATARPAAENGRLLAALDEVLG